MTTGLAIIGAGPAGMAAATLAAELGVETALIDEQASPGGQIYRGVERPPPNSPLEPITSPAAIWPRRCAPAVSNTDRIRHFGTSIPTALSTWKATAEARC